jgi:hypothetical protein
MRRIRIPIVLALAAAVFAGPATPAAARTPLTLYVECFNLGGWNFYCFADATGGTGSYPTYSWSVAIQHGWRLPASTYSWVSSNSFYTTPCSQGDRITATVTVTDSGGATASGTSQPRYCSQWAD